MRGVKRRALTPDEREEALEIARRHGLGRVIGRNSLAGLAVILFLFLVGDLAPRLVDLWRSFEPGAVA